MISQGSTASALSTAHAPSPQRQPFAPPAISLIGTVKADPAVAPIASAVVYSAVIGPMRSG